MVKNITDIDNLVQNSELPFIEIISILVNLCGINTKLPYRRIRFDIIAEYALKFSVENNSLSRFSIENNYLCINGVDLFPVENIVEDSCEILYTRNNGSVISFNPNNRSRCIGCNFCYQPSSHDKRTINRSNILSTFSDWMKQNGLVDLSSIRQIALVTGCFPNEESVTDYLLKMRDSLKELNFCQDILYIGMIKNKGSINILSRMQPFHICFTVECFEHRNKMLKSSKNVELTEICSLMELSNKIGIDTSFSYILGLDSLESIEKNFGILSKYVTQFPIVSLYQTDERRILYRHPQANSINYYLEARKIIERCMAGNGLTPSSWNNYRSLWRTYYDHKQLIF